MFVLEVLIQNRFRICFLSRLYFWNANKDGSDRLYVTYFELTLPYKCSRVRTLCQSLRYLLAEIRNSTDQPSRITASAVARMHALLKYDY